MVIVTRYVKISLNIVYITVYEVRFFYKILMYGTDIQ